MQKPRSMIHILNLSFCFILVSLYGACTTKEQHPQTHENPSEAKALRVGYLPIAECLPLFVAKEKGYCRNCELLQFSGGSQSLEALSAGSVDIALSNIVSAIFGVENDIDFVSIWGTNVEDSTHILHSLVVRSNSKIRIPNDFYGKTIALNTRKNIDELMLRNWLTPFGIPFDKVKIVEIPFPRMSGALENGSVDAIAVVEPFLTVALSSSTNRSVAAYYIENNPLKRVEITSYFSRRAFLHSEPGLINDFTLGLDSALVYMDSHRDELIRILRKYTKVDSSILIRTSMPNFSRSVPTKRGLEFLIGSMRSNNWIHKNLNRESLVNE